MFIQAEPRSAPRPAFIDPCCIKTLRLETSAPPRIVPELLVLPHFNSKQRKSDVIVAFPWKAWVFQRVFIMLQTEVCVLADSLSVWGFLTLFMHNLNFLNTFYTTDSAEIITSIC